MMKNYDYKVLFTDIKKRIVSAQYDALKKVNKELISLYWDIGKMIIERQKEYNWGMSVVEKLSIDLNDEFPGVRGFSTANLWRMKNFYENYSNNQKLAPMVREIGWSHNIVILEKCKDDLQREFYIRMTKKLGWSKNVLIHQIENKSYEKTLLNQTNFEKNLPENIKNHAKLSVKDDYVFDFLELSDEHSERQLENSIKIKIEDFLREMGGIFSFIGTQYKLTINDKEYFIDILLFHRVLRCMVAIELKVGEFLPEYIGKMQFYLALLDDRVRLKDENSSIGIILCKSKDKTIVEYALRESNKPIGVSTYKIVSELPEGLEKLLPDSVQISKLIEDIN